MEARLKIQDFVIDRDSDCFVIAEIGHNHQGRVDLCKQLFDAAKEAGAHSVKLQKRDNRSLFTEAFYNSPYNSENAYGDTYGAHREALEFGMDEYRELKAYAESLGLIFFATAFDIPSADFLEALDIPCYKIASGDLTNIPLLKHVARFGKPMIISTGGGTMEDVRRAVEAILPINRHLAILQCTTTYPTEFSDLNLNVIRTFQEAFPGVVTGLSSHDSGIAMSVAAYMLGGRIVEKHFTLNRAMKGTDHAFSLEPVGLKKMVRDLKRVRVALGDGVKTCLPVEASARMKMGKKIVAARALPAGHVLTDADLAYKSPGDGLAPYHNVSFIGQPLNRAVAKDEALTFEHIPAGAACGKIEEPVA
jgi:N-acetylneuraminate synthase/sialic acid synthase